jgi:excisionase family DNA binding protein
MPSVFIDPTVPLARRKYLTIDEVSVYKRVSRRTVFRWLADGKIRPFCPVPRRPIFLRADIDALVVSNRGQWARPTAGS